MNPPTSTAPTTRDRTKSNRRLINQHRSSNTCSALVFDFEFPITSRHVAFVDFILQRALGCAVFARSTIVTRAALFERNVARIRLSAQWMAEEYFGCCTRTRATREVVTGRQSCNRKRQSFPRSTSPDSKTWPAVGDFSLMRIASGWPTNRRNPPVHCRDPAR